MAGKSVRYVSPSFLITLFCVEYGIWGAGVQMFFLEKTKMKGNSHHVLEWLNCVFFFFFRCLAVKDRGVIGDQRTYGPHLQADPHSDVTY